MADSYGDPFPAIISSAAFSTACTNPMAAMLYIVSGVTSENTNVLAGMGQQWGTAGRAGAGKGSFSWFSAGAVLQLEKSKSPSWRAL